MIHKKLLITALSVILLVIFSSTSFAAVKSSSKTTYAKRHGYRFPDGKKRVKIRGRFKSIHTCKFMGMHWQVDSKKTCGIWGFTSPRSKAKCRNLRTGWKIKEMTLNGNFVWTMRPVNTTSPTFKIWAENNSTKAKAITVRNVTLIGPEGPANSWQQAFNHCSDPNYRA
jgi:hypothetical protein